LETTGTPSRVALPVSLTMPPPRAFVPVAVLPVIGLLVMFSEPAFHRPPPLASLPLATLYAEGGVSGDAWRSRWASGDSGSVLI